MFEHESLKLLLSMPKTDILIFVFLFVFRQLITLKAEQEKVINGRVSK